MDVPSINRLPPELLVAITTFITDQSTIFRLATVCRHWHDALTEAATLWTSIDCRSESRTSILLQRSRSIPICVTVDCTRYAPEAVSLVANHTHRMRSIDVTLSPRALEAFRPLLYGLAPILRTVRMQASNPLTYPGLWYPPYSLFFQGQFPALRTLYFKGFPFDLAQSAPVITNGLTTLVLDNQQSHHLRDFLEYLEHCKNLEHLKVDLPGLQGTTLASHTVSLPKLRELELVSSPPTALHHLSFPPSTVLTIKSLAGSYAEGYPLVDVWTKNELLSHVFESRTIKSARMTVIGHNCIFGLSGSHLALTVLAHSHLPRTGSFHSTFLDAFQSFPIETTEFFAFAQLPPYEFTETLRPQSCARLLTQMPALKRLTLDITVAPSFIHALEPVDGDLLCPKLRHFTLIPRANRKLDLQSSLLVLSNRRKERGCPLTCGIGSPTSSDWEQTIRPQRVV